MTDTLSRDVALSAGTVPAAPTLEFAPQLGVPNMRVKRAFDLAVSVVLFLLLFPVLLLVALAIKLTDPRAPVFYAQLRIGRDGAEIAIVKFRSMRWKYSTGPRRPYQTPVEAFVAMGREDLCAEFLATQKVQHDPRITRLGRILRRTSVDELPQLFNVLLGEVSLVGPRPVTADELERYGDWRANYLALQPGVTGLWQVSGRNDLSYAERVACDRYYAQNWSMWLDVRLLARTAAAVVGKRGAY